MRGDAERRRVTSSSRRSHSRSCIEDLRPRPQLLARRDHRPSRSSYDAGRSEILAGPYIPNNHELFSLLAWATASVFGESEAVLRLPSVLPFIAGVALVTWWLHVRLGALSGLLFLFLATVSPLLLDITRQARGYGLAFLAMSVLVVCALELRDREDTRLVDRALCGGVVGTCTLPHFGVAFLAIGAVLLRGPRCASAPSSRPQSRWP